MSTEKHTGESTINSSRRDTRVFLQIGLKFTSDNGDLLLGVCILLTLMDLGTFGREATVGDKLNNT